MPDTLPDYDVPTPRAVVRRKSGRRKNDLAWVLVMGLPGLSVLAVFVLAPLLLGLSWSFTDKRLTSPVPARFIGQANYDNLLSVRSIVLQGERDGSGVLSFPPLRQRLRSDPTGSLSEYSELFRVESGERAIVLIAKDPTFWRALFNTIRFAAVIVPCQSGIALVLALLVNSKAKGMAAFRTIFFMPVVVSMAVVSVLWMFILNPGEGLLNRVISSVAGPGYAPIRWLVDPGTAHIAIYMVSIWQSAGFQMVIFLAGLQGIPDHLHESARLDGAGPIRRFVSITWPMLRNTTVFVLVGTTILAFRVFTQIDVMTHGGPRETTISLIYYIVQKGFREQRIGYASAVTIVFFILVMCVSILQRNVMKSMDGTE